MRAESEFECRCEKMRVMGRKSLEEGRSFPAVVQSHLSECEACVATLAVQESRLKQLGQVIDSRHRAEPGMSFRSAVMARVGQEEARRVRVREVWSVERAQDEFVMLMRGEGEGFKRGMLMALVGLILIVPLLVQWGQGLGWLRLLDLIRACAQWCIASPAQTTIGALVIAVMISWGGKWLGERMVEKMGSRV